MTDSAFPISHSVSAGISQPVKLVILDLDNTFWRGTLSEGQVELDDSKANLLRTLAECGIVSRRD